MIKLTGTIVDTHRSLIGFLVEGKDRELGGFLDTTVTRPMSSHDLVKMKLSNNQISIVNNIIVEKGQFRINSLPMKVFNGVGYIDMSNDVSITKRFIKDNEHIGFRVKFADESENNYKIEQVITICNWFKPKNFMIRTSSAGKKFISGKQGGIKLEDLPAVVYGTPPVVKPKKLKSGAKEMEEFSTGTITSDFDILDVYDFINECNGCVINLPSIDYKKTVNSDVKVSDSFTSLGIGEIASARPEFNSSKLNVNANFKKVGVIDIEINGSRMPITTFTFATKCIFHNGENHIEKMGIAIPIEKEEELIAKLSKSLALEKITDTAVTSPLAQIIDAKSLVFYKVDLSNIGTLSKSKMKTSIMTSKELTELCIKQYGYRLLSKYLSPKTGIIKEIKASLGDKAFAEATDKKLFGMFALMGKEALEIIAKSGIDVYSGAFKMTQKVEESDEDAKGASKAVKEEAVAIEYIIKGFDPAKVTGKQVIAFAKNNDTDKLPEQIIKLVNDLESTTDETKKLQAAIKLNKTVDVELSKINKKFWMHNVSMFTNGDKKYVHSHDHGDWNIDTTSKVKIGQVFCNTKNPGLTVKLLGTTIE